MKKLFFTLLFTALLFSCSSDDDNSQKSIEETVLEGSWLFQRLGEACDNDYDLEAGDPYAFKFLENNTIEFEDPGYLSSSMYTIDGNNLTLETIYTLPSGSKRKFVGNYTFSEDTGNFTGTNTFTAYNDTETQWTCQGTTSISR
ncbi:hypothetical protein KLA_03727 [Cellulophaga geojensis KL-A]|uniref:Lipocalin-like domain-containing protein n=1 Tax=Cellulophaga geojensis KL-A TaxID=1328323 RepID=A0ABN0RR37_9FLAO|nr:hypothetical protein [Cellulophaga geojensis]EWH14443.1 hypothetical protein KLA_03727 [Cellulophaga geojensis KL-A]